MGDILSQFGGWVVGLLAVLGTIFYNNRKVKVDESALILANWKDLNDNHKADMKALKEEIEKDRTRYEAELEYLRVRLKEVETDFKAFRKEAEEEIKARDVEIAGLKRTISQISQSTAVQLGRVKSRAAKTQEDVEAIERLDRAGDNSMKGDDQ